MCVRHGLDAAARYGDTAGWLAHDGFVNYASAILNEEEKRSSRVAYPSTSLSEVHEEVCKARIGRVVGIRRTSRRSSR